MHIGSGSPLSIAIIGVEDLDASLRFYRDLIGLEASEQVEWRGPAFERHWHLPPGASAQAMLLASGKSEVGRILLLEFNAPVRRRVRQQAERRFSGLFNLNFYTRDIHAAACAFAAYGYELWSEPVEHQLTAPVGRPIEVLLEGPDAVVINLVQLTGGDEQTRIGEMRRFLAQHGTTRTGCTEVVTSAHCVRSREAAIAFYQRILGMEIIIDEVLDKPESNRLLKLPVDARSHLTFLKGNHLFGKVVLIAPLNYEVPDLAPLAVAPNIGYLAMSFAVPDLSAAQAECRETGADLYSPPTEIDLPGIGWRQAMIVRAPGSNALIQLFEFRPVHTSGG